MKETLVHLYLGRGATPRAFRFALLAFDVASVLFFLATPTARDTALVGAVELAIAAVILVDLAARIWIAPSRGYVFREWMTWIDIVVVITLVLPFVADSLLFLRVFRALRLLRSFHVLRDLREEVPFFKRNEEVVQSSINLIVFVFIMTALVFVSQHNTNPQITNYVDALYFTVAALTTTGFGDVTLVGTVGRLLSVVIMVLGVALFLRLIQTIFRPTRVAHECPDCGLNRHEADAVHCRHCGRVLHIATEGHEG